MPLLVRCVRLSFLCGNIASAEKNTRLKVGFLRRGAAARFYLVPLRVFLFLAFMFGISLFLFLVFVLSFLSLFSSLCLAFIFFDSLSFRLCVFVVCLFVLCVFLFSFLCLLAFLFLVFFYFPSYVVSCFVFLCFLMVGII